MKFFKTAPLLVITFGLLAYGAHGLYGRGRATLKPAPVIGPKIVSMSTDTPSEVPPKCSEYTVAASEPRSLSIPSLQLDGCIQRVGIDQHHQIAVPNNIHVAGWYINSVKPGYTGNSIIDAHVQGRYEQGLFKHIAELKVGQKISVQYGDMSSKDFEVLSVNQYSIADTSTEQYRQAENVDKQLTLITCGGFYDKASQMYNQRVLVRAKAL